MKENLNPDNSCNKLSTFDNCKEKLYLLQENHLFPRHLGGAKMIADILQYDARFNLTHSLLNESIKPINGTSSILPSFPSFIPACHFEHHEMWIQSSITNEQCPANIFTNAPQVEYEYCIEKELVQNKLMISKSIENTEEKFSNSPLIPGVVYDSLPGLLHKACNLFEGRERDIFLTSALTVISGCLNISGTYHQRTVYANLFSFVIAPAASGKGSLIFAKELAMKTHRDVQKKSQEAINKYQQLKLEESSSNNIKPVPTKTNDKPHFKKLFIPADSSAAAIIGHLHHVDGRGIICETEADTLSGILKKEWGGFSDIIRKSFHHEAISCERKGDGYIEVEKPRISISLSGTPGQVSSLIKSSEDGLFSRFIYYIFKEKASWKDVSHVDGQVNLNEEIEQLSRELDDIVNVIEGKNLKFNLTCIQWKKLNNHFAPSLNDLYTFFHEDISGTVKRMGLIAFRIAMLLTALRKSNTAEKGTTLICDDIDFKIAIELSDVYLKHAMLMFSSLPGSKIPGLENLKLKFYEALPHGREFMRSEAIEIGNKLKISERTVNNYLKDLLGSYLSQEKKLGPYKKIFNNISGS